MKQSIKRLDLAVVTAASLATACLFLHMHAHLAPVAAPSLDLFQGDHRTPVPNFGWWSWWDQSSYIQAAAAWRNGVLDPVYHWYLPGYPLLGALFAGITPAEPFMLPDLICLVAALWLFAGLAARLLGNHTRHGLAIGALVFVATSVLPERVEWAWVVPWSTTPLAVCMLACLLATARFTEHLRAREAFLAALAAVTAAAVRPADAAALVAASAGIMAWTMFGRRPSRPQVTRIALAAATGAAIPAVIFGAAYLVIWGPAPSGYIIQARAAGFEWRLLPLRWVELVIDPKPFFPEGRGIAAVFPWVAPGIAGMLACLVIPSAVPRRIHALVIGAVVLDMVSFLVYRDLHPKGLWQYGNFHYFKWTLPVFGLYALLLLRMLAGRTFRAPALATVVCTVLTLFMWRIELAKPVPLPPVSSTEPLLLPSGLPHVDDVLLAKAGGDPSTAYMAVTEIRTSDRAFENTRDFKVFLWADTLMILPLRPLPAVASIIFPAQGITLTPGFSPVMAKQKLVWGLPCWIMPGRKACQTRFPFPPTELPLNEVVRLGSTGRAADYLLAGWSVPDPGGRWTDGSHASLRFALPAVPQGQNLALEMVVHGYATANDDTKTRATVTINGRPVARWRLNAASLPTVQAPIPPDAIGQGGTILLDLLIDNPRRPWHDLDTPDTRDLGLYVESFKLVAALDRH